VHGRGVVPEEEGLVSLSLRLHPGNGSVGDLLVDGFHALLGERPRVFDLLLPDAPPARVLGRVVDVRRGAAQDPAGTELLLEARNLGIVGQLRLLLGVEVVEIAEELVEAVDCGQELVAIAQVVLAELARGVAERLEQLGDGGVFWLQSDRRAGHPDLGEARADRILAGDEARAAGGAALLGVVVGESYAFFGYAVD